MAFQSLRSYVELVAAVQFTVKRMEPLVRDAVARRQVSHETAQSLANHVQLLLHGGRFNWTAYFEEGAAAVVDRKRIKRTREEKAKFEMNSLRIGKCIEDWGRESPAAEFIYDYLSDLIHPNKCSNLVLLVQRDGGPVFDVGTESRIGIAIFERICRLHVLESNDRLPALLRHAWRGRGRGMKGALNLQRLLRESYHLEHEGSRPRPYSGDGPGCVAAT